VRFAVTQEVGLKDYIELRSRFDRVVERLTTLGKVKEADYHMIYFFLFFEDFERLRHFVEESEHMLETGEW
jgi:hypothetical protein